MATRLPSGATNRWTLLLNLVKGNRSHLLSLCKSNRSRLLTLCEGSRRCLRVSVPAQQIDSDDEETAFFLLQNRLSLTRNMMSESGPRWMKVATPPVTVRVGQLAQNGISTCWFSVGVSRGQQTQGFHMGGNTVAGRRKFSFALAFTSELGGIHHLSGTIESWELPGDGPFLFPIDAQARLGLIKDMAKSRIFIENKSGFYLRRYKDAKTGLMLINVADVDLLNDQALTPQLLRASKPMYALAATIPPPTCITGGATASGEHVDVLRSLLPLPGNHTLRFTHVTKWTRRHGRMAATSVSDIVDELVTSLLERLCVDDSQKRYIKRTSFSLIVVLSEILPAVLCETIGESIRPRSPRF